MSKFPKEWHKVINDTSLVDDVDERISVRSWTEFFRLQEEQDFNSEIAAQLVFGDKAAELVDAVTLAKADA